VNERIRLALLMRHHAFRGQTRTTSNATCDDSTEGARMAKRLSRARVVLCTGVAHSAQCHASCPIFAPAVSA